MERRKRRTMAVGAFAAALAISALAPSIASAQGNVVGDLLNGLLGGAQGGGGSAPAGNVPGSDGGYQPPLHGSNPHGQGTVGVADLVPSSDAPLPSDPGDGDEDVVIGDTQGEQNADGSYQGRVTLLHANLLGVINLDDLLGDFLTIETSEGESKSGPLEPLNEALGQVCEASQGAGGKLCLNLLDMQSSTTADGSTNSFEAAGADVALGPITAKANVANSNGNISDDGTCQTASGDSSVASADVVGITADALQGSSSSTACQGGSNTQSNDSEVLNIAGFSFPIPVAGCGDGTANAEFTALSPLLSTVCNADDSSGSQTSSPYGVREALAAFVLPIASAGGLVKVSAGGPESHAVAPASTTPPTTDPPTNPPGDTAGDGSGVKGGQGGGAGDGGGNGEAGSGGPASTAAQPGDGKLAFTGTNLIILAMIGAGLVLGGLLFSSVSGRGRRATA
jgi:hypothetical protein